MPQTSGMASRGKLAEQSEVTRAALVAAARDLFAENGFAATTTEEIVQRAKVTRGALYHHFTGKEELFRAVYEALEKELAEQSLVAASAARNPIEQLRRGCDAFLDACLEPGVRRIVLLDGPSVLGWETWHEIGTRYSYGLLRAVLESARKERLIGPGDVDTLAHLVQGALVQAGMALARANDQAEARRRMGAEVRRLVNGLRTRPARR